MAWIKPILIACLVGLTCFVLAALVIWGLTRKPRPKADTKLARPDTKPTRPIRKKPNPLLNALATVCLLIVLYLIFFTDNWPLVVLFALIGLVFNSAARS